MDGTQGEGDRTGRPQKWTEAFRELTEEGGITQDRNKHSSSAQSAFNSHLQGGQAGFPAEPRGAGALGLRSPRKRRREPWPSTKGASGGQGRCPEPCAAAGHSESVASSSPG